MKIACFGGAFNPVHLGHVRMGELLAEQFESVRLIPSGRHAFKGRLNTILDSHRLHMLKHAFKHVPQADIDSRELEPNASGYMVDTLAQIRQEHEKAELFCVLGADNLPSFNRWFRWEAILDLANLVVFTRKNHGAALPRFLEEYASKISWIEWEGAAVSSTEVRERLAKREDVRGLVSDDVLNYIERNQLYQS